MWLGVSVLTMEDETYKYVTGEAREDPVGKIRSTGIGVKPSFLKHVPVYTFMCTCISVCMLYVCTHAYISSLSVKQVKKQS